jgi:TPR repeat protein
VKKISLVLFILSLFLNSEAAELTATDTSSKQVTQETLERMKSEAAQGDSQVQFELGLEYILGPNVTHNLTEAASWFRLAAGKGHRQAQANLGLMYYKGLGVEQDWTQAASWLQKAAVQGEADSQYRLAWLYLHGYGLEKNRSEAIKRYRQAADQGHSQALFDLGSLFLGYGRENSAEFCKNSDINECVAEGISLLKQAAQKDYLGAFSSLSQVYYDGTLVPQDKEESARWLRAGAGLGSASAQFHLGRRYYKGDGLKEDKIEAAKWYNLASSGGDVLAQLLLAKMYATGDGLEKDLAKAAALFEPLSGRGFLQADLYSGLLKNDLIGHGPTSDSPVENTSETRDLLAAKNILRKRADLGEAEARLYLGLMALSGLDGPPDRAEAFDRLKLAAEQGLALAQFYLAFKFGSAADKSFLDEKEVSFWYRKAAERGVYQAQVFLASRYAVGQGLDQSYAESLKWYLKAAGKGFPESQYMLGELYLYGQWGAAQDYDEAIKWFNLASQQGDITAKTALEELTWN